MSESVDHPFDEDSDELLAAEYVLGALSLAERLVLARRCETDPAFARLVAQWEERLAPFATEYADQTPPARVKAAIDARLFAAVSQARTSGLWQNLMFWRGAAGVSLVALALAVALPMLRLADPAPVEPAPRLLASLAVDDSDVRYLAFYDPSAGEIGLSRVSGSAASGRDLELWVIRGEAAPVSLGLVPAGDAARVALTAERAVLLEAGALLAISDEPQGGSPTGQPTGAVVALGDLRGV